MNKSLPNPDICHVIKSERCISILVVYVNQKLSQLLINAVVSLLNKDICTRRAHDFLTYCVDIGQLISILNKVQVQVY